MAGIDAENNHQKEPSYDMARCLEALAPDRQSPGAALRRTRDHGVAGLIRLVFARLWRRADSRVSGVPLGIPGAGALARFRWTVPIVRMYRCAHNRCARRYERPSGPDRLEREDLDNRTGRRRVYWLGHPHCQTVQDVLVWRGPHTRLAGLCWRGFVLENTPRRQGSPNSSSAVCFYIQQRACHRWPGAGEAWLTAIVK